MIIYKTTNLVNGKVYVGKDAYNRSTYFGSGNILRRAIAKYGKENFKKEILEVCKSLAHLAEREKYWIAELHSTDRSIGYNLTEGGNGGDTYSFLEKNAKETRRRELRAAAIAFNNSEEGRQLLSKFSKEMWKNESHRKRITKLMIGREITWAKKISKSITKWHKTNPITPDGRKRMSEAGKKTKGREVKKISNKVKQMIIDMYQSYGPKTISTHLSTRGINASPYVITRILRAAGIYQKWQKGIAQHST